ncbi:MAG: EVE domain-containing protein, partial [Bacteroidota bacterium]
NWDDSNLIVQNILFTMLEPKQVGEKYIVANITWNSHDWKEPSRDKTGHRWVKEGGQPHESWNFDFENPRNADNKIYGYVKFTQSPKVNGSNNLIIFYSQDKVVGFYGKTEVLKSTVHINSDESYNLIGDKDLSICLVNKIDTAKGKGYLEDLERVGQIGFSYIKKIETVNRLLDEAIAMNPDQEMKLQGIKKWVNIGTPIPHTENYWIFQGNPKMYRIVDALKDNVIKNWSVTAHKNEINISDKAILWITGEKSGCYALCKVISSVENRMEEDDELKYYIDISPNESLDRVQLELEYNWWDQPILKQEISEFPEFNNFNVGNRGTNFSATKAQYDKLLEMYWENGLINNLKIIADRNKLEQYFKLLSKVLDKFELKDDDPRISFSTPKSPRRYISASIGQRYIISLEKKKAEYPDGFELGMIAAKKDDKIFINSKGFKTFGEFSNHSSNEIPPYYAHFDESVLPVDEELIEAWLNTIEQELKSVEKSSFRQHHNPMYFKVVVDKEYRD